MNRSCRNSQEKKSNEKKQRAEQKTPLFFCTKNPLPRMIADIGAGARFHILSQHKIWYGTAIKKSATTNDSGYGCRGTPLLKD